VDGWRWGCGGEGGSFLKSRPCWNQVFVESSFIVRTLSLRFQFLRWYLFKFLCVSTVETLDMLIAFSSNRIEQYTCAFANRIMGCASDGVQQLLQGKLESQDDRDNDFRLFNSNSDVYRSTVNTIVKKNIITSLSAHFGFSSVYPGFKKFRR